MSEHSFLPPNSSLTERALEAAWATSGPDLEPVAQLMSPDTCPAPLLGWLAWALSVDVWDASWSEDTKRQIVRDSIAIHRAKGTRGAVERALGALGFATELSEWFEYGGAPHTFRIDAYGDDVFAAGLTIDPALLDTVTRLVETVKPVRAHFALRVGQRYGNRLTARSALGIRQRADAPVAPIVPARAIDAPANLRSHLGARAAVSAPVLPAAPARRALSTLFARGGLRARQLIKIAAVPVIYQEAPFHAA